MERTRHLISPRWDYLWKYVDLYKFIDLICTKKLFFTSLDQFDDIFEGCSEYEASIISQGASRANIPMFQRNKNLPKFAFDNGALDVVDIWNSQIEYQQNYSVCCFFESKYESVAMWNLYSGVDGITLRFNADYLYDYLVEYHRSRLKNGFVLMAKRLRYKNLATLERYDDDGKIIELDKVKSPFNKDRSYQHEREYRFVLKRENPFVPNPVIDLSDFDFTQVSILIPTNFAEWKIDILNALMSEFKIAINIERSTILTKKDLVKYKEYYFEYMTKKP